MPQLSLKISHNIDMSQVDFLTFFKAIHHAMGEVGKADVKTCHSGVIQEDFSYIGFGDDRYTKMYLEVYWLETAERRAMKDQLAAALMKILEEMIVPQIEKQKLVCIPRVRIANLGEIGLDYYISKHLANEIQ